MNIEQLLLSLLLLSKCIIVLLPLPSDSKILKMLIIEAFFETFIATFFVKSVINITLKNVILRKKVDPQASQPCILTCSKSELPTDPILTTLNLKINKKTDFYTESLKNIQDIYKLLKCLGFF